MNTYRVSYTIQLASGKITKAESKVIANSADEAVVAVQDVYGQVGYVAITQVEAIALSELF